MHHDLSYVLITNLMHKFSLFLYNIPLHVLSNNAHLQEVTLLYTCSILVSSLWKQVSGQLLLKHNFNSLLQSVIIRSEKLESCRKINMVVLCIYITIV